MAASPRAIVDVEGQHHAVIGAANGVGRMVARRLSELGATVLCMDADVEGAGKVAAELPQPTSHGPYEADVRGELSVRTAFESAIADAGQLHGVVNCAGVTGLTGVAAHEVDLADFDNTYKVNMRGAFLVSQQIIPHMVAHGYGRLLHFASISGKDGNAGMAAYSSTKAGLIGLVKVLGKEYAETGVTINALAPAVIRTQMVDALPPGQVDYMTDKIPMGRCGTVEEAADMATWIISPACSFTTGFTFDLTGGRAVY